MTQQLHSSNHAWLLSLLRRQKTAVSLTLTFMLSLGWARLEKELKDGSTACATAIKRFDMTADWQWRQQKRGFFFSFFLFLFSFFTLAPNDQKKRESNPGSSQLVSTLRWKGRRNRFLKFVSLSSFLPCYLSLLSLVYLCQLPSRTSNLSFSCMFRPLGGGA